MSSYTQSMSLINDFVEDLANNNQHVQVKELPRRQGWNYNCWGCTALLFGWISEPVWLNDKDMDRYLSQYTVPVSFFDIQDGDIVVYRNEEDNELLHTAVLLDAKNELVVHKPGPLDAEVATIHDIAYRYNEYYGNNRLYRRVIGKEMVPA